MAFRYFTVQQPTVFRVSPVMTTLMPIHLYDTPQSSDTVRLSLLLYYYIIFPRLMQAPIYANYITPREEAQRGRRFAILRAVSAIPYLEPV